MSNRTFTTETLFCEIVVKGHLDERRAGWFGGMQLLRQPDGVTRISGVVADQSALYGLINRVRDLGLSLVSISARPQEEMKQSE